MPVHFRQCVIAAAVLLLAGCGGKTRQPIFIPPLSAVVLDVSADTVQVGSVTQFTATAYDLSSQPVSGVPFLWTSSNPAVFTVNGSGVVTGRGEGEALLYVEAGGMRDTADVLVLPATSGWFVQTSNSSFQLNDVYFHANGRHGCAVGNSGEVLLTFDAGATWQHWSSGTAFNLNAVWFVSDSVGWAVGGNGTALRTLTGGRTWTLVPTGVSDNLMDVTFMDPDTGWAVGSGGAILRTRNGTQAIGVNWNKQTPTANTLNGVSVAGSHGWAVGNGGVIAGTHDFGLSWFTYTPSVTGQALMAVWRRSEGIAFAAGAGGVVPRTITPPADTTQWELLNAGAPLNFQDVMFVSDTQGWAVGDQGGGVVRRSLDGAATWDIQSAPTGNALRAVYFVDELRGWAVGDNGRILHTGTGGE